MKGEAVKNIRSRNLILTRETIRRLTLTRDELRLVNGGIFNDTVQSLAEQGGCTDDCPTATCKTGK
jgi:hypothetical protein